MASATDQTHSGQPDSGFHDDDSSLNSALFDILPENIPNSIITKAPEERFKLGYWSVVGLIVNRVIGTGIFNSPTTIMRGTSSVGITLLFWVAGAIYTTAGAYLSVEFGLTTPRHKFEGVKQGIPRSGGTLNYLQYAFPWPAYRHRTVLLITCLFATAYIVLGNMAGNCLIFGIRVLEAAEKPVTNRAVRGLAIGAATFACGIHAISRRGGIVLGNVFAFVKVCMLLMMIIIGVCAWGGAFEPKTYVQENMAAKNAFSQPASDSYGYVKAFLSMIFAWSGFDQPNYVLGEIGRPRKKFPRGTAIGVGIVILLYILVNVSYMVVVPKEEMMASNVALAFFERTLGSVSQNESHPSRILAAIMAVSSFGNIVVMTFTAARVKQEIAKEGILPWAKFFGQSKNLSFGRFLSWIQKDPDSVIGRNFYWLLKQSWMNPREHSQETPFGALFLHWVFTILMIAVTAHLKPTEAYTVLVDLYTYTIVSVFGFIVAVGMLRLRFSSSKKWRTKSPFRPAFSVISAFIFALGSVYPIVASWVPPSREYRKKTQLAVDWYITPVVAWSVLGLGLMWYHGFKLYAWRRARKGGVEFQVQKVPEFDRDPPPHGPPVQVHETVFLAWVAKENNSDDLEIESRRSVESF